MVKCVLFDQQGLLFILKYFRVGEESVSVVLCICLVIFQVIFQCLLPFLVSVFLNIIFLSLIVPPHTLSFEQLLNLYSKLTSNSQSSCLCLLNAYYTGMHQHIQLLLLQFWSSRALLRNCHFSSGRLVFEDFIFHLVKAKMLRLIVDSVLFLTLKVALFVTHNLPSLLHSFNVYSTEVF